MIELLAQVVAMVIGLCLRCCACMVFVVAMYGIGLAKYSSDVDRML
jgi:hypothetical protein